MILRLVTRGHTPDVVAARAFLPCPLEEASVVARLAGYALVRACEREARQEVIEVPILSSGVRCGSQNERRCHGKGNRRQQQECEPAQGHRGDLTRSHPSG